MGGTKEKVEGGMLLGILPVAKSFASLKKDCELNESGPLALPIGRSLIVTWVGWLPADDCSGATDESPKLKKPGMLLRRGPTKPSIMSSISGSAAPGVASKSHRTQRN